jgi:hypothetical protein
VIIGLHLACAPAHATVLNPGDVSVPIDQVGSGFKFPTGTQVGADLTVTASVAGDIQVAITSQVFRDSAASNKLDFVYTVTNTGGSGTGYPNSITSVAFKSFAGFLTDAGYYGDSKYDGVGYANRSQTGQSVVFAGFLDSGQLNPGETFKVIIKTDATDFTTGASLVTNDCYLSATPTYAPAFAATPEPSAVILFATGIIGLAIPCFRRWKLRPATA